MDEFDLLEEDPRIKTHREILELLKELDDIEHLVEHPELIQDQQIHSEITEEKIETIAEIIQEDKSEKQPPEILIPKKKRVVKSPLKRKRTKKPKVPKLKLERKHHYPWEARKPRVPTMADHDINIFSIPQSTFALHIDEYGNLVGFHVKTPEPETSGKKGSGRFRFLRRKKQGAAGETPVEEPPAKGIKGKLKRIIPHRRKKKESSEGEEIQESGKKSKLKGLIPRRKKSKE